MKYRWGIFFIVHSAEGMTMGYEEQLYSQIHKTRLTDPENMAILVLSSRFFQNDVGLRVQIKKIEYDNQRERKISTLLYDELAEAAENIGSAGFLAKMLDIMKKNCDADRYMLFTWDHGAGFGIFNYEPKGPGIPFKNKRYFDSVFFESLNSPQYKSPFKITPFLNGELTEEDEAEENKVEVISTKRFVTNNAKKVLIGTEESFAISSYNYNKLLSYSADYDLEDDEITDMLTMDELNKAIAAVFKDKKISVLVMMNCWMQMIETGFAFRDTVDILVAPETTLMFNAYNYPAIFEKLNENPTEITNEAIAVFCSKSAEKTYSDLKASFSKVAISAVRPALAEKINDAVTLFFESLDINNNTVKSNLKKLRNKCTDISKLGLSRYETPEYQLYNFIDFVNYFNGLNDSNLIDDAIYKSILKACDEYVIPKSLVFGKFFGAERISGFLVFHPTTKKTAEDFQTRFYNSKSPYFCSFARNSKWKDYIDSIL